MQYLANEFLEKNYKNVLKIYTDGSVMDDGAAGAAFVDPEFNNMTHSFSLHAVSIYTAELVVHVRENWFTHPQNCIHPFPHKKHTLQ